MATDTGPDNSDEIGQPIQEISGITLLEDEAVLHDTRLGWSHWSTSLILGVLTIWVGIGIVFFAWAWLGRRRSRYIVTTHRVIYKTGLLSANMKEYRIQDIRQLQTSAGWLESRMGHGHITVTVGNGQTITFSGIPDYSSVAHSIRNQQQQLG